VTTHPDDQPVVLDHNPDELRAWLTAGTGADLSGQPADDVPADQLPEPGTPVSVMRNTRLPWEVDVVVKALAEARGISVSEWIREAITGKLAGDFDTAPDPVVELRLLSAALGRTIDRLDHRDAA